MALDPSSFPDKKLNPSDFPDKHLDASGFPDQAHKSFPSRVGGAINAVLDPIAESPVVKGTMQAVGERPEIQPLSATPQIGSGKPVSGPMDVVREGAGSAEDTLAAPIRAGATLQGPQMIAQQKTMDYLTSKGANKYVALAAGMLAGAAADPINVMASVEVGKGVDSFINSRNALKSDILKSDMESSVKITDTIGKGGEPIVPHETIPSKYEGSLPPLEPGQVGYKTTESLLSESTNHMELPLTTEFYPKEPPTKLSQWMNSAVKELDDLNSSKEIAAPTDNPHGDFSSTVRRYFGHQELARFDAMKMTDEFAGFVPDKDRRMLLTLYSQMGRPPTMEELNTLRTTMGKVKSAGAQAISKSAESLMDQSLSLVPQEENALKVYNGYFDGMGKNAQKMGILDQLKDIYGGPHTYEPKADVEKGFIRRLVTGKSKFSQHRTFENVIEAVQNNFVPKTLDSAELISVYHNGISRAASERFLMDTLEKQGLTNYEGRGSQIKGFQSGGMKIKDEIYKRVPYSENPEVQKVMARIAEDPVLDYPVIHAIEKFNNFQKLGSLYLQVFHPKALAMEALGKGFSPAKFKEGLDLIDKNPDYVRSMIRSGLDVNVIADVGKNLGSNAAKEYRGSNPAAWARKINSIYNDWTFSKYMTGLKIWNSNVLAKRFIEMGLTKERALELSVEDSNRTFGGLNLGLLHRSPNMQRLFHMMAFAPDWTESRLRQMTAPFGRGLGDVTSRESKLLAGEAQRYWTRTVAMATVTHIAGMVNPYEKVLSVDMSAESGFKDVTKLSKILGGNFVYFSSKMAAAPRTMEDFMNPRMSAQKKVERVLEQVLPIPVQRGIQTLEQSQDDRGDSR